jgi:hypothetical protein
MHNVKGNMLTPAQVADICAHDKEGLTPRETSAKMKLPLIVVLQVLIDNEQIDTQDLFGDDHDKPNRP